MNLNKVYRGKTKDGKYRLLYKMIDIRNKSVMYKDLETKETFTSYFVLENELVPFDMSIKYKSNKKKVIRSYKSDKNKFYNADNLFVGDLCIVEWKYSQYINQYFPKNYNPMDVTPIDYNILFVKLSDDEYQELVTNKVYKIKGNKELNDGELCVDNLRNCSKELNLNEEEVVSKDLVLRKSYKKFKGVR